VLPLTIVLPTSIVPGHATGLLNEGIPAMVIITAIEYSHIHEIEKKEDSNPLFRRDRRPAVSTK